jgi:hypothetical protein
MKCLLRFAWFSLLGLAVVLPLAGCQEDNEAGVDTGKTGTGDPKYTTSDDSGYRLHRQDHLKSDTEGGAGKTARKK